MKRILSAFLILVLILSVGCGKVGEQNSTEIVTFQMEPSGDRVEPFLELLENTSYEKSGRCYRISPQTVSDQYGFHLFKFDSSCAGYLLYEDVVYPLGEWFGGYGLTSFAVADLNRDGKSELYFTCSWGSGLHRSQAGYFDSANRQMILFDFSDIDHDSVLAVDENGTLSVYRAADCDVASFVEICPDNIIALLDSSETIPLSDIANRQNPAHYFSSVLFDIPGRHPLSLPVESLLLPVVDTPLAIGTFPSHEISHAANPSLYKFGYLLKAFHIFLLSQSFGHLHHKS